MKAVLVFDLGTTNIKAIVYDENGIVQAERSTLTPVIYKDNSMEINPADLWDSVKVLCKNILSEARGSLKIFAVSLSSMAATLIPVDENGLPLYNAIGWADGRPLQRMNCFLEKFNTGYRIRGCGQYPLPMYAAFKIPWFNEKAGDLNNKIYKWINISDYIYSKLIGINEYYTDYSIASRTMLFDDVNKCWNREALREFDIEPELLPKPFHSGFVIGEIGEEIYSIGLPKDTLVVLGGHDHMCASLGAGITRPGIILNSTGTSEAMVTMLSKPYDIESMPNYWINSESSVLKDEIMAVAYTSASGQIFNSVQKSFFNDDKERLESFLNNLSNPLSEPIYIPSLRGSLPSVSGTYLFIPTNFNSGMMAKAALLGINYESRRVFERMCAVQQLKCDTVRIAGGQARNDRALQTKCNIIGCAIERPKELNISSKGAFILAASGCGIFDSASRAADLMYLNLEKEVFYPDRDKQAQYQEVYYNKYLTYFKEGIYSI